MSTEKHLDPAKSVIAKIGGVEKVAEVTGKHVSRVYRWMYPRSRGGTGGHIPPADAQLMLRYARDHGLELAGDDFFELTPERLDGAPASAGEAA